jgi:RHH-type proline utilization regulon transcriptional repressor/proline dehydrogenase/delta 1-pyrroline-5-carboxylate dehydrogenase
VVDNHCVVEESALIEQAVDLARKLQARATGLQTPNERRQQRELDRMLQRPEDKATLVQLTDEAFRSRAVWRMADHLTHILDVQGVPRFFNPLDRALLRGFRTFGAWLPGVAMPLVKEQIQHETANVVLPAEGDLLRGHLAARQREGVRMNLNLLGEAVLGEEEAGRRLERCLEALQLPEVEVLSVKISTLYSQLSGLARERTVRILCDRLETLYRTAARLRFTRTDGSSVPKFIYLDMEEYRDLHLTADAFMRTLDRPGLEEVRAGIALQAYVADSAAVQREINHWAEKRAANGGVPVTIRLVKGANMEAERVDAVLHDWPQAPFGRKVETDANYKRMLREGMRNLDAVHLGVASHNLFDVAYGLALARSSSAGNRVQFEMLEGMANHQRRALLEESRQVLLYAPACRKEEFLNAIGYLLRRLDENTGPDNFLRHAFSLSVDAPEWRQLERGFRESFSIEISDQPRRTQDRLTERFDAPRPEMKWNELENEADTDWSLPANSQWAEQIIRRAHFEPTEIPLVIAGQQRLPAGALTGRCLDPSRPDAILAHYAQANNEDIERAVRCAVNDPDGWRTLTVDMRSEILGRVAHEIRQARADLIGAAMANGGKILSESDPEVSEAVDFLEFYRAAARYFYEIRGVKTSPRGVAVVVPPWNFPISIPCGGIAAVLAAGNTVILKPASDTVLIAFVLCQCFWRAGVPKSVLQFAPCPGNGVGQLLVTHPDVNAVILTGGTATARHLLRAVPEFRPFAETGGKNATIVTALSDRELAVKHVVHSAFSHSGQKCSATSLLLLEAEVYDDPQFQRMLCDAVKSLDVGSAWELHTRMGPLIRPPRGDLENGLKTLEPGESWALRPQPAGENGNLWTPGIKYGVQPGSYTHNTEFFGPVLGVMRFDDLDEAIALVNQTGYGLTSGLQSLDDREQSKWKAVINAGNVYINRSTTGAIVLRQPFGGVGKSSFGPSMKAGGPNYIAQFMSFQDIDLSSGPDVSPILDENLEALRRIIATKEIQPLKNCGPGLLRAIGSYDQAWQTEFGRDHDHFRLLGQDNLRRYLPFHEVRVRVSPEDSLFETIARLCAARVTGARVLVSTRPGEMISEIRVVETLTDSWGALIEFIEETDDELAALVRAMPPHTAERIRFAAPNRVPRVVREAAAESGEYLADEPVLAEGRIELLWYLREQSISFDYHRYGNLGPRASESRRLPK